MENFDKFKEFVAVKFRDKSHEIVPKHWIIVKKSAFKCYYPPNNIRERAAQAPLPDTNWKSYKVDILTSSRKFIYLFIFVLQYINNCLTG